MTKFERWGLYVALVRMYARPIILREVRRDSCIFSTSVGVQALKKLGVPARPMTVKAMVFNRAYFEHTKAVGRVPENPAETQEWQRQDGSWAIGLGVDKTPSGPGRWPGHLVVLAANDRWLLDLSLDQANRPQHTMSFEPVALGLKPEFLRGEAAYFYNGSVGGLYYAKPDDQSFVTSPDWGPKYRTEKTKLVDEIIRKIKKGEK